jgi:ppGpp synthetase/RelA/SpoT-type nucleotidyltranferase
VYALAPDKQEAVATETRRIWCSLAERLGMFAIKSELEDLCFAVLEPSTYGALRWDQEELWGIGSNVLDTDIALDRFDEFGNSLEGPMWLGSLEVPLGSGDVYGEKDAFGERADRSHTSYLTEDQLEIKNLVDTVLPFDASTFNMDKIRMTPSARRGLEVLQRCAKVLLQELVTEGVATNLDITVHGRVKSLYSSFKKMARKGVPLSEVYDVRALRVVVDDQQGAAEKEAIEICYKVLPVVHRLWRRVPGEEDDYITIPKPSGYQSLHTAVIGPGGVPMEVQIRTSLMHEEAEYGKAAHWAYKERPVGAESDAAEIAPGHPVLRISSSGKLRDGVVVKVENGGNRLLVASSYAEKAFTSGRLVSDRQVYKDLFAYVTEKGYFTSSQGDMNVTLELFTMCSDNKYHQYDRFGQTRATRCVPLQLPEDTGMEGIRGNESASAAEAGAAASSDQQPTTTSEDDMSSRIRLLRSMIEWGGDVIDDVEERSEIMVLSWPSGKILRIPNGTTAGDVFSRGDGDATAGDKKAGDSFTADTFLVNVNNRLVPSSTKLADGDFVVVGVAKEASRYQKVRV